MNNIDLTRPVQVYRNLNKPGRIYSVRQGGRVRGYVESIVLRDVRFKHASPKQLHEVRTGARQVCQWVSGMIGETADFFSPELVRVAVACDPKTSNGFTIDGRRIDTATVAMIGSQGCYAGIN